MDDAALETWAVATFDLSGFVLVAAILGHASGVLPEVLRDAGTLPGLVAFAYLWGLGVVAIRWALPDGGLHPPDELPLRSLAIRGGVAGSFIGAGFVVGVLAPVVLSAFLTELGDPLPFLTIVLAGGVAGLVVGAAVGLAFVVVDVALYRATDFLVPRSAVDEPSDPPGLDSS